VSQFNRNNKGEIISWTCPKCDMVVAPASDRVNHRCTGLGRIEKATEQYRKQPLPTLPKEEVMDQKVIPVENQATDMVQLPARVIEDARLAAKQLTEIVNKKSKKVMINGEQYLEFEDWQTLSRFYGLFVKTGDPELVEIEGVKGFKAQAQVVNRAGVEVGSATAYCLKDEPNWKNKPTFQLASMAQTRAGAKALRNLLAWVAVLAGYKPTPAEEMDGIGKKDTPTEADIVDEPLGLVSIEEALNAAIGTILSVQGILSETKARTFTKKDKTKGEVTDYYIASPDNQSWIWVSKFGDIQDGIHIGDTIIFEEVEVQDYKGEKKFLAKLVSIVEEVKA
jgi:hypothetical protein